jgi:ribosome-binding factor A
MLTNRRSEHLEKVLKRLISDIIYKEINDPRIKFVTITRVKLTPKLEYAKIYITIFNDKENIRKCLKGLKNATSFIRHEIGKDLKLRRTPEIEFLADKDMLTQYRILDITKKIKENAISENEISENEQ